MTLYQVKTPPGVCFETSSDRYLIKKRHTISELMLYFRLSPLYCQKCSVETAQQINNIEDVDYVSPGQILIIPQKCANFSWKDNFDYEKRLPKYSDADMTAILKKRGALPEDKKNLVISQMSVPPPAPEPPLRPPSPVSTVMKTQPAVAPKTESTIITTTPVPVANTKTSVRRKIQKVAYHRFGTEPFTLYSELNGSSGSIEAKLISGLSSGVTFYYQENIDPSSEWILNISLYQTEIHSDANSVTLNNRLQNIASAQGGLKYHRNSKWTFTGLLGFGEYLYFEQTTATELSINKFSNINLSIIPEYTFYKINKWTFLTSGHLSYLLPTTNVSKVGALLEAEIKANYKFDFGRAYAGMSYQRRIQDTSTFKITENALIYKLGMYYLF